MSARRSASVACAGTVTCPLALTCGGASGSSTTVPAAVSSTRVQCLPKRGPGTVKVTGSVCALNRMRNESSRTGSPRGSGSLMASPFRNTAIALACGLFQSRPVISRPAGVSQAMSAGPLSPGRRPRKNRRRRNTGWRSRKPASPRTYSSSPSSSSASSQSSQETSLSWQ